MEPHVFFAFFLATTVMIALPGPSVLLTVAHSISFGSKKALITVAGATVGIGIQLTIAAIGLTSLLNSVVMAFELLRWLGAVYLVYLGIKQWKSSDIPLEFDEIVVNKTNLFLQGVIITVFNPKSLIFIAAFLPQFINLTQPVGIQFMVIIPTFLFITFSVTSLWVLAAGKIRTILKNNHTSKTVFRSTGGLMILSGLCLAFARRGN